MAEKVEPKWESGGDDQQYDAANPLEEHEGGKGGRGNYRCSRCGGPKKGHVCPYQPGNYKCVVCGNVKKNCTCGVPLTRTIAVQCEMDEDMTTRVLDLRMQVSLSSYIGLFTAYIIQGVVDMPMSGIFEM
ncbi:unnamed protein product [Aphanomyces euteiches]